MTTIDMRHHALFSAAQCSQATSVESLIESARLIEAYLLVNASSLSPASASLPASASVPPVSDLKS